jgi:hypothetical protein
MLSKALPAHNREKLTWQRPFKKPVLKNNRMKLILKYKSGIFIGCILLALTLYVIWLFSISTIRHKPGYTEICVFPYFFIDDDPSPHYTRARLEGKNASQALAAIPAYALKYYHKKPLGNSSTRAFFDTHNTYNLKNIEDPIVKIGFGGDLMWIRKNWNGFMTKEVLDYMQQADFWMANLESPVSASFKVQNFFPDYLNYNSDTGLVSSFVKADGSSLFKVLSVANNHSLDKGEQGLRETCDYLLSKGILPAGTTFYNDRYTSFVYNNIRIGVYAACWGLNNPKKEKYGLVHVVHDLLDKNKTGDINAIKDVLNRMKADHIDLKIISLHWGYEFEHYPTPDQMILAREFAKWGADIVFGHHPHIIQPYEILYINGYEGSMHPKHGGFCSNIISVPGEKGRKTCIFYSLGNFTSVMFTQDCRKGYLPIISIYRKSDGTLDWELSSETKVKMSQHILRLDSEK